MTFVNKAHHLQRVGFSEGVPGDMILANVDPADEVSPLAPPELPLHEAIYDL
jgi:L-fuculose-phosphate aldolase